MTDNAARVRSIGTMYSSPEEFIDCVDAGTMLLSRKELAIGPAETDASTLKDALAVVLSITLDVFDSAGDDPAKKALCVKQMILAAYNLGRIRG